MEPKRDQQVVEGSRDFSEPEERRDVELVVEGKSFHLSKSTLAEISPVFDRMFFGDFKEKGEKKVELPGKSYSEMLEFLRCVYPPTDMTVYNEHVRFLLVLAREYQVDPLYNKCLSAAIRMVETYMYHESEGHCMLVMDFLLLSETHGFNDLKKACLRKSAIYKTGLIESCKEYGQLSGETKFALLRKRVDTLEKRIR